MADSRHERAVDDLAVDFGARIEGLRRDGVPSYPPLGGRTPWAEAPEAEKLEQIVWESMSVWLGAKSFDPGAAGPEVISLPGAVALEAVERHVDYAGLPEAQRAQLVELRARLDAGQFAGPPTGHKDPVADGLQRAVGVGHLEDMLQAAKEGDGRPWAVRPEAEKVKDIVGLSAETAAPGGYTLAVIEREVDYAGLPPWRREALEGLRARLDRGDAGHDPLDLDGSADLALRLAELEARVEDDRQLGARDAQGQRWPWAGLAEKTKLDLILVEMGDLHLESEPAAYDLAARSVDPARLTVPTRREFEEARAAAGADRSVWNGQGRTPWQVADDRDEMPTPEEWQKLKAEWTHDYGLRRLEDRGVRYEDEIHRALDHAAVAPPGRLPSPGEIADGRGGPLPAGPEHGKGRGR